VEEAARADLVRDNTHVGVIIVKGLHFGFGQTFCYKNLWREWNLVWYTLNIHCMIYLEKY